MAAKLIVKDVRKVREYLKDRGWDLLIDEDKKVKAVPACRCSIDQMCRCSSNPKTHLFIFANVNEGTYCFCRYEQGGGSKAVEEVILKLNQSDKLQIDIKIIGREDIITMMVP